MPIPFAPNRAFYEPSTRAQDIILRQGDDAARAAQRSGQIWGGAIQNLGGIASRVVQDRAEQKAMSRRDQAVAEIWERSGGNPDPRDVIQIYGPKEGIPLVNAMQGWNEAKSKKGQEALAGLVPAVTIMKKLGPELQAAFWQSELRPTAIAAGLGTEETLPAEFSGEILSQMEGLAQEEKAKTREVKWRDDKGVEHIEIVEDKPGQQFTSIPEPPKPPDLSLEESDLEAYAKDIGKTSAAELTWGERQKFRAQRAAAGRDPKGPREITPTMEANIVNRLTTQWTAANKTSKDLNNQVRLMDAGLEAARRGDLSQGAQAVLVTFQKVLDPTSVVRESEFARSAAGQSLFTRIEGAFEKLTKGGAGVPLEELEKFANLAREAVKAQQADMPAARSRIARVADRYGIPQELIFEEMPSSTSEAALPKPVTPPPPLKPKGRTIGRFTVEEEN